MAFVNYKNMTIKIKKPLCKKVEKIAKSGNKTKKKKTEKSKEFSLSRKERIKAIKKQLRLK